MRILPIGLLLVILFTSPAFAAPTSAEFPPKVRYDLTATIQISTDAKTSSAIDLYGTNLVGIFSPTTLDGTSITFTASPTLTGSYLPVDLSETSSAAYTITTASGLYSPITTPAVFDGVRYIKMVTATSQTSTDTVFILATRPQ